MRIGCGRWDPLRIDGPSEPQCAPGQTASRSRALGLRRVHVEKLQARGLQPPGYNREQPVHEHVAEGRVALARGQKLPAVERERVDALEPPCLEMLALSHEERRPAELVARLQGLDAESLAGCDDFERYQARADQIEIRALVALA